MARKNITFTAEFLGATRTKNSVNGNPSYILHTSEGDYRMASDASLGYALSNYMGGPSVLIGQQVEFTTTAHGRVFDMKPV